MNIVQVAYSHNMAYLTPKSRKQNNVQAKQVPYIVHAIEGKYDPFRHIHDKHILYTGTLLGHVLFYVLV